MRPSPVTVTAARVKSCVQEVQRTGQFYPIERRVVIGADQRSGMPAVDTVPPLILPNSRLPRAGRVIKRQRAARVVQRAFEISDPEGVRNGAAIAKRSFQSYHAATGGLNSAREGIGPTAAGEVKLPVPRPGSSLD